MALLELIYPTLQDGIEIIPEPNTQRDFSSSFISLGINPEYPDFFLLAQINLSQIPEGCFQERSGILQFYILRENLYHPSLKDTCYVVYTQNFAPSFQFFEGPTPFECPFFARPMGVRFQKKKMAVPTCGEGFKDTYDEIFSNPEEARNFEEAYFKQYAPESSHQFGGVPAVFKRPSSNMRALLQIALGKNLYFGGDCHVIFVSPPQLTLFDAIECQICWR